MDEISLIKVRCASSDLGERAPKASVLCVSESLR